MGEKTAGAATPATAPSGKVMAHRQSAGCSISCTACSSWASASQRRASVGEFRATLAAALERQPADAALIRQRYRETLAPQLRGWSILSANYRTLGIFIAALFKAPEYYFGFEIIGFSAILAVLIHRQSASHEVLVSRLRLQS